MRPFRKCPVCASRQEVKLIYRQEFAIPDAYEGIPERYDIVECSACGCVYDDVDASQTIYDRYYAINSKYENLGVSAQGQLNEGYINFFRSIAQGFTEYIQPDSSILDIGCATGGMLCALRAEGFSDLTGLEMSEACVEQVRSMGIDCYKGGVMQKDGTLTKKFDIIIMSQVMEHIYDVKSAMGHISSMLKENGMLFIDVPDAGRYHDYYIKPFYYFDLEHINHFTKQSLINLGLMSGFETIKSVERVGLAGEIYKYPNIAMLYRKHELQEDRKLIHSDTYNLKQYFEKSLTELQALKEKINIWEEEKRKIIIWGIGAFSLHYFKKGLGNCRIISIVDNDIKKQGLTINQIKVKAPDTIKDKDAIIVVTAALYQKAIREQISRMGLPNEVYCI